MKTVLLISFLIFSFTHAYSHQVVSVRDGDFFSDSVWAGGVQPDLTSDSIYIETYLHYYQNIVLNGTCYMYISHAGTLCGAHDFNMFGNSYLWIKGSLYMDSMQLEATLRVNGYLDGLRIRQEWPGSYVNDSCGETYIHLPPQSCAHDTFSLTVDTRLNIQQSGRTINMSFSPIPCGISDINFGDGDSAVTNGYTQVTHTYSATGTYIITVKGYCIACSDTAYATEYRTIKIDSVIPPCSTPTSFVIYPNPSDAYFYVKYESCQAHSLTEWVYDDIGQKVREVSFDNSGTPVKVESDDLAAGIYYIKIPEQRNRHAGAKKIVVVH